MSDPFSIFAASVSVADVALRSISEIHKFGSSLRRAPDEHRELYSNVASLEGLIIQVKGLCQGSAQADLLQVNHKAIRELNNILELCIKHLIRLREIVGKSPGWFGISFLLHQPEVQDINKKITDYKLSIISLLAAINRRDGIEMHRSIKTIESNQLAHNQSIMDGVRDLKALNQMLLTEIKVRDYSGNTLWMETVVVSGSAADAADVFKLIHREWCSTIVPIVNQDSMSPLLSRNYTFLIEQDLRLLVSSLYRKAAHEYRINKIGAGFVGQRRPLHDIAMQKRIADKEERIARLEIVDEEELAGHEHRLQKMRSSTIETLETKYSIKIPTAGTLILTLSESIPHHMSTNRVFDGVRVLFIPLSEHYLCGVAGSFIFSLQGAPQLGPLISTFRVLSSSHPVWGCIEKGDVEGLRRLLGPSPLIHPNDRAPDGWSLLGFAVVCQQLDICQLLLQEGADPMDCSPDGWPAFMVFYCICFLKPWPGKGIVDGTRNFIKVSGADLAISVNFSELNDSPSIDTSLIDNICGNVSIMNHALTTAFLASLGMTRLSHSYDALQLLLNDGGHVEETDHWGNTALGYAAIAVCLTSKPRVMRLLLKHGAKAKATNRLCRGVLHLLLEGLSGCECEKMGQSWKNEMQDVITLLLRSGCDPNAPDGLGWTPSMCCSSPAAWMIWCDSLVQAGLEVGQVLAQDDEQAGRCWAKEDIQRRVKGAEVEYLSATASSSVRSIQAIAAPAPCNMCGGTTLWRRRRPPFDCFAGYFEAILMTKHNIAANRTGGRPMARPWRLVFSRDGPFGNGVVSLPSAIEMSWRTHVAYWLWKDGHLGQTMADAEAWAADLDTLDCYPATWFEHESDC